MRALVLSGGGSKGAYQVGALKYLIKDLNKSYDIICGVSVGAINTAGLGMYKNDLEGFNFIHDLWTKLNTSHVYKRWFPFGKLHALWKKSLYNSQPLINLIHEKVSLDKIKSSGKKVAVGSVSLSTGEYHSFDQNDKNFVDGILASSAFPGALKPITIDNQLWIDGGVKHITPLKSAIQLGAKEVDIIICSPVTNTDKYNINAKTISLALRSVDLMSDQIMDNDLKLANQYNEMVKCGYRTDKKFIDIKTIRPIKNLIDNSLDFSNDKLLNMINIGYEDAKQQYK